jgi:uncharacterized UPF0146 family protein
MKVTNVTFNKTALTDLCSMETTNQQHWETIYQTKTPNEVSWTQKIPTISLQLIAKTGVNKHEPIIDVGGGDSNLVDYLLKDGYTNITVLDISASALERAKKRLGADAHKVKWIVEDITHFNPSQTYSVWHDRAAFHFLTQPSEVNKYIENVSTYVSSHLILGTFSVNGPLKCSGLPITQYSQESMLPLFNHSFQSKGCITDDHITPFGTQQNFLFCSFIKK